MFNYKNKKLQLDVNLTLASKYVKHTNLLSNGDYNKIGITLNLIINTMGFFIACK